MLIDFSVENFRSFRDKVTLSLIAGSGKELPQNKFEAGDVELVRAVGIYGPNASGKSNLVEALRFVRDFVVNSGRESQRGDTIPVRPFALDPECADEPSRFEIAFRASADGKKYVYSFAADGTNVVAEDLTRYDSHQPTTLFSRICGGAETRYKFSSKWHGTAEAQQLLKASTRDNALLLSVAARLNAEDAEAPFDWFRDGLSITPVDRSALAIGQDTDRLIDSLHSKAWVLGLIGAADIGIADVSASRTTMEELLQSGRGSSRLEDSLADSFAEFLSLMTEAGLGGPAPPYHRKFLHWSRTHDGVWMEWQDESAGTRQLYALAGWIYRAAALGHTLVIDEIDASLHPLLQEYVVRLMNDPNANTANGQLIFTTHNTNLMHSELLRRDQVWFVEKNADGASEVYSLWDFQGKPRPESNYALQYLHGRFGAVPVLGPTPSGGRNGEE